MHRRELLVGTGAALVGLSALPLRWASAAGGKKHKILYFTRSAGFEHSVVHRKNGKLSHSEKILTELGKKHGIEVVCSKDGRLFDGDLDQYDAFAFYTTGYLTAPLPDKRRNAKEPPLSKKGEQRFLEAIAAGKGFIGFHAATDSCHSRGNQLSGYVKMIGGEFVTHGAQQRATMKVVDPKFPGIPRKSFQLLDEWYSLKNFANNLHVLLVQETEGMKGKPYQRPPYPATWARMNDKGRVFYTSMGHREDVWTNPIFQQVVLGGLSWILRDVNADVTPNIDQVTPKANQWKS